LHKIIERRNLKESTKAPKPGKQGKTEGKREKRETHSRKSPEKGEQPKREFSNKGARSSEPDCTFECTNYAGCKASGQADLHREKLRVPHYGIHKKSIYQSVEVFFMLFKRRLRKKIVPLRHF